MDFLQKNLAACGNSIYFYRAHRLSAACGRRMYEHPRS